MTYISQADLELRFGRRTLIELTDRADPPAGSPDTAVIAGAIADAAGTIDAHLAARYALPLAPSGGVPRVLQAIAGDLVFAALHVQGAPEDVQKRREGALRQLVDIRDGRMELGLPTATGPTTGGIAFAAGDRVFTASTMKGF